MHALTVRCALRAGPRPAVAALRLAPAWPSAAFAADGVAPDTSGLWWFVTVAFIGVALASFLAGRWRSQRTRAEADELPFPAPLAATQSAPVPTPLPVSAAVPEPERGALARQAAQFAEDPRPVLLLESNGTSTDRVLAIANAPGLQLLGVGAEALGRPWSELELGAPAALRTALAEPGSASGWWLLHDGGNRSCLALGPDAGGADGETASLVYTVTHDLRAPIRVVEGFTRIVKEDYGRQLDRVGNDHLDRVLAAGARMNQMIDAVLTMARLSSQPLARQPVDLSQLAGFVLEDLRRAAPERDVEVQVEPGLRVRGDPTLLRLVLENLLGNAWKYSARAARARIEFGAAPFDGRRVFAVRDNGAGFDMRAADRLFGLFQRLHSAKDFPGTGVGLASVRRIVQRHGGEVWAESEPGRGATFFFTLRE